MLSDRYVSVCPLSVCNVDVLWPNGWMDKDATWFAGRPRPTPRCVRWGPSSSKKGTAPHFRPMYVVAKRLDGLGCRLVRYFSMAHCDKIVYVFISQRKCLRIGYRVGYERKSATNDRVFIVIAAVTYVIIMPIIVKKIHSLKRFCNDKSCCITQLKRQNAKGDIT